MISYHYHHHLMLFFTCHSSLSAANWPPEPFFLFLALTAASFFTLIALSSRLSPLRISMEFLTIASNSADNKNDDDYDNNDNDIMTMVP